MPTILLESQQFHSSEDPTRRVLCYNTIVWKCKGRESHDQRRKNVGERRELVG
jgi:hypothetical protein